MQKVCGTCKQLKSIRNFGFRDKAKKTHRSYCKACQNTNSKRHYAEHLDYYRKKARKRNISVTNENYEKLYAYLREHPCVDCGERDITVLEFDHTDPTDKKNAVTELVRGAYKWETVLEEIAKCTVLCCNCHRRRTAIQFNWRKANLPE